VRYLEVLNPNNRLDASCVKTSGSGATTSWSGFSYLNGQEVKVIGDSFILENATPISGALTSSELVEALEAGFEFLARIKHLPLRVVIQGQFWAGEYKNPVFANVSVYNSRDFIVKHNDQVSKQVLQEFVSEVTEADSTLYTKWLKVYIGGSDRDVSVEITQDQPLELNVLATHFGVRVS